MTGETTYRPGDIVNGHILSEDGTAWLPLDPDGYGASRAPHPVPAGQGPVAPTPVTADLDAIQPRPRAVQGMQPTSTTVIWVGVRSDVKSAASGGALTSGRYRLTEDGLYFQSGMLSSQEAVVPLYAILDVGTRQSMTQRLRGVGDCVVSVDTTLFDAGAPVRVMESVPNPHAVRDLVARHANVRRQEMLDYLHGAEVDKRRAGAQSFQQAINVVPTSVPGPTASSSSDGVLDQLRQLGELKALGVLTDAEFEAQKARILAGG